MRLWLVLSVAGYATKAVPTIVDKALLHTKAVKNPATYAVAVSGIGGLVLLLAPFVLTWPPLYILGYALASGATFTLATLFLFAALKHADASRVTPFIGAAMALTTAGLAYLSLSERLGVHEVVAFLCLVLGGFLVTRGSTQGQGLRGLAIWYALGAAVTFSLSLVLSKAAFDRMPGAFLSAIVWMRFASLLAGGVILLAAPSVWRELRHVSAAPRTGTRWAFLGGQASGAVSGLLLYGAVALATKPSLVNALGGLEFLFVVLFSALIAWLSPKLTAERFNSQTIVPILASIGFIGIGLWLLVAPWLGS